MEWKAWRQSRICRSVVLLVAGLVMTVPALAVAAQSPQKDGVSFEVATIKPSAPGQTGRSLGWDGRRFTAHYTTLSQMMQFAYGVQAKQIVDAPGWFDSETYDIDAQSEASTSDVVAWRMMMQRLLTERLDMRYHHEQRVMPAYLLTVAKGGPKLDTGKGEEGWLPGVRIQRGQNQFMKVVGVRASMTELAAELQRVEADRPVVDKTGLESRFNFTFTATSIKPFFAGESPATGDDAPPELFTAIQEQLGLKLQPAKTEVDCLVLDHVQRPSGN